MSVLRRMIPVIAATLIASLFVAPSAAAQVRVVNLIPARFGDETVANPEPTLAVNPVNRSLLAVSSFILGKDVCMGGSRSPILVSRDTGQHWSLVCKLATDAPDSLKGTPPGDVVLRWTADGKRLYAALIWPLAGVVTRVMATDDLFSPDTMRLLAVRNSVDQPDLLVSSTPSGYRILVGGSYKSQYTGRAKVLRIEDGTAPSDSVPFQIERRSPLGENYAMRMAAHASGRVYAIYNGVAARLKDSRNSIVDALDITVVRDDSAGGSASAFAALKEKLVARRDTVCQSGDGMIGVRVARCRPFPLESPFGFQRRAPVMLSIATDPSDARGDRVYVAWADSSTSDHIVVNVAGSMDGGQTWRTLLVVPNALNPSLAVDSTGRLGLLLQQLADDSAAPRWVTRLLVGTRDNLTRPREYELANTAARSTLFRFQPFIGDYVEVHAIGTTFMGVFSAANDPDPRNFPNGVQYQRRVDTGTKQLLKQNPGSAVGPLAEVGSSIDPFFFSVGPVENPRCAELRRNVARLSTARRDPGVLPSREPNADARAMAQLGCIME